MPRPKTFSDHPVATPAELQTLREMFAGLVVLSEGCWGWLGSIGERGEGYSMMPSTELTRRLVMLKASRVSWVIHYGHLRNGKVLACHRCDNPWCVRPDHLFVGSQLNNMMDAQIKGRLSRRRA